MQYRTTAIIQTISLGLQGLSYHKLRAFLTLLGIMFGVGAVIAMLSIGEGAKIEAIEIINLMGAKNIIITNEEYPEEKVKEIREKTFGLTFKDFDLIKKGVPFIMHLTPQKEVKSDSIVSYSGKSDARIIGTDSRYPITMNLYIENGRFFSQLENQHCANVCVIGYKVKRDLFGFKNSIGQRIKIDEHWFTVIGEVKKIGIQKGEIMGIEIESISNHIYIPINTARKKFEFKKFDSELSEVAITMDDPSHIKDSAILVEKLLLRLHRNIKDFKIIIPEELLRQTQETQRIFNIAMSCIAGIALLVGGIGIMNIMLASILERRREIGIRRAVGARQIDILIQFIGEAVFITLIGGLIGIGMGYGISETVRFYTKWRTLISPLSIIISFSIAVSVGLISGIYPAYTASKLNPIAALRYE